VLCVCFAGSLTGSVSAVNIERPRCPIDVRMNAPIYTQRSQQLNTRAFTVVELLVVIGIIVLLGALFLPALSRAKAQGQSASCKNHLRQIGLAMAMYVADHNRYPPLGEGRDVGRQIADLRAAQLDKYRMALPNLHCQ
jgi:competence protein ComGC